ncbi:hypothetical protein F9K07_28075 [Hydrogenophaga sp. BPS33]|nr:hypothetical protein F9K07_22460 [Hydrogenophaga sp. BPS33]QHE88464.1 hypothetical protein F9K07_28075 [Hydrogenophaga sp. BPS33]
MGRRRRIPRGDAHRHWPARWWGRRCRGRSSRRHAGACAGRGDRRPEPVRAGAPRAHAGGGGGGRWCGGGARRARAPRSTRLRTTT